jgi:predicted MarR family transcription regulator
MAEPITPDDKTKYILQHIMTGEFVTRTKAGKKAEYTLTKHVTESTKFSHTEANTIIAATAMDNGKDTEKEFLLMETLKAIAV